MRRRKRSPAEAMPFEKYRPYPAVELADRTWPDQRIEKAPIWCSVDLRDGNQALVEPMDIERKQRLYDHLIEMGFEEIEVGFPSASQPDFDFCRKLIKEDLIPDNVTIQVLTQARPELIERTFAAIEGCQRAIVHLYNSTSTVQRRVVFKSDRAGIIDIAVAGALKCQLERAQRQGWGQEIRFQYSPESYTGTEPDYARQVCEAVMAVFEPTEENPLVLNLPATVEMSTANLYGDLIERFHREIANRQSIILSLHPHNDRGTAVAAAEFGLMAGADRVEGTLFGNGERTGNVDIVTLALNLMSQGVNPRLDISDIETTRRVFEYANRMNISPRHPYAGELVFTAFSGGHQDAIKKSLDALRGVEDGQLLDNDYDFWEVAYLLINPHHVGRSYEGVVRINSQSGKGGIAYVLLHEYGLDVPRDLQIDFYPRIQALTEASGSEITSYEVHRHFLDFYAEGSQPHIELLDYKVSQASETEEVSLRVRVANQELTIVGQGQDIIEATTRALQEQGLFEGQLLDSYEHGIANVHKKAQRVVYLKYQTAQAGIIWGVGQQATKVAARLQAVLSVANQAITASGS